MVVLGFDSATADAVVGVTAGGRVVRETRIEPGPDGRPRHSQVLLGEIERSVEEAGGWERIDRIAVGVGPGSFTGLRIGIATARALAQAREIPIAPAGSLAALARAISEVSEGAPALPVIDARRSEAFAALFDDGTEVWLRSWRRRKGWRIACGAWIRRRWRPETGRYDSPQSWRPPAPWLPRPQTRSTESPQGTFARWVRRRPRRRRTRSNRCI